MAESASIAPPPRTDAPACAACLFFKRQASRSGTCYKAEPTRVPDWHACEAFTSGVVWITNGAARA